MSVARPQPKQGGNINARVHARQHGKFHDRLDDSGRHTQVMESRIHHYLIDRVHS
jgi:hypothetical protein